jgi:hypothetical protein
LHSPDPCKTKEPRFELAFFALAEFHLSDLGTALNFEPQAKPGVCKESFAAGIALLILFDTFYADFIDA